VLAVNLIGANRVIIFDASFNPCHDAQAVCRVYRYGQQKKSYIYRLIADNTMEKKIYDRQINKQNVSDRVVDEIQSENHFTRTEVEKLIHYVKEDAEPADLSNIYSKCNDQVLINTCLKYNNLITKEPFKHESLLLDKKEYQLSNREKRDAFKHYEYEKRMPLNSSKGSSYAASYFAKLNATNRQVFFILL
jgi:RAD54-like protein 2